MCYLIAERVIKTNTNIETLAAVLYLFRSDPPQYAKCVQRQTRRKIVKRKPNQKTKKKRSMADRLIFCMLCCIVLACMRARRCCWSLFFLCVLFLARLIFLAFVKVKKQYLWLRTEQQKNFMRRNKMQNLSCTRRRVGTRARYARGVRKWASAHHHAKQNKIWILAYFKYERTDIENRDVWNLAQIY